MIGRLKSFTTLRKSIHVTNTSRTAVAQVRSYGLQPKLPIVLPNGYFPDNLNRSTHSIIGTHPNSKVFRLYQSSSLSGPLATPEEEGSSNNLQPVNSNLVAIIGGMGLIAALVAVGMFSGVADGQSMAMLKAGFLSSFSIIFVSELGDKTFFIAALLAMRRGKMLVLTGTVAALSIMTIISVGIGMVFQKVPAAMTSGSIPVGEYLGAALLAYFGVMNIMDALKATPSNVVTDGEDATGELADAEEMLENAESTKKSISTWGALVETFTLIFVAEWGDRSMLATIALSVAQNPYAVAVGAIAGHTAASIIAVVGGSMLSKHISERVVGLVGGVLFLVFAVATIFGVF